MATVKARYIGPGIVTVSTPAGSFTLESGSDQTVDLPEGEVASSTIWEVAAPAPTPAPDPAPEAKTDSAPAKTKD